MPGIEPGFPGRVVRSCPWPRLGKRSAKGRINQGKQPARRSAGGVYARGDIAQPPSERPGSDGDFPGGPVVETPCCQRSGYGFIPWSGN